MSEQKNSKFYVTVVAKFNPDGSLIPLFVEWDVGHLFSVDEVLDLQFISNLKTGGNDIRYTVLICKKEINLFLQENRWFVERPLLSK